VEPLLVRAARREALERTPVWFMRQAGRSLPEYRRLRERHGLFEINRSAELTAEVTLQPVRRHGVDAAVIFADIMTPVAAMGVELELVEGVGPVVAEPVRSAAAVERLALLDPRETVGPVLDAIALVRRELSAEGAVVGFCGGPFTVAGYLVEGRPSRDFTLTKSLMYREPAVWEALLEKLALAFTAYALAQAAAGADVVQLFDSWAGALSPADYREFAAPFSARVLEGLRDAGVPSIHFATGSSTLLRSMAAAGGDVIGLDWRTPLDEGWTAVGEGLGVQGNLDPVLLLGPWARVEAAARDVLARAAGRPGHIFNLGHGVLPTTDPASLGRLVELVQAESSGSGSLDATRARAASGEPAGIG
jgi:uroporphyrinogen decarboxylase